eukprot:gene7543-13328_t
METLIRNKYERKLYIKKDGEPPLRKSVQAAVKPSMEEKKEKPKETRQKPTQTKRAETKVERKAAQPAKPAAERQPTAVAAVPKPQVSPVIDLLGMDNPSPVPAQQPQQPAPIQNENNDFDLFMQSTPASSALQSQAGPASQNPMNAFGTPPNINGESLMLEDKTPAPANTKASIMSLYQSGSQQQKPIYGVPGGLAKHANDEWFRAKTAIDADGSAFYANGPAFYANGPAFYANGPVFHANGPAFNANGPAFHANGPAFHADGSTSDRDESATDDDE